VRLKDADERKQIAENDRQFAETAYDSEKKNCESLDEEWTQWKTGKGLPPKLTPEGALSLLIDVRTAAEKIGAMKVADDALRVLESEVDVWQRRTRELLKSGGVSLPEEADENRLVD